MELMRDHNLKYYNRRFDSEQPKKRKLLEHGLGKRNRASCSKSFIPGR